MDIKGTVTLDLDTYEKLKAEKDKKEYENSKEQTLSKLLSDSYEIDASMFLKEINEIDQEEELTDRQLEKKMSEAMKTLRIVVNKDKIKKAIVFAIKRELYEEDDVHQDLKNTTEKELKAIEISFDE